MYAPSLIIRRMRPYSADGRLLRPPISAPLAWLGPHLVACQRSRLIGCGRGRKDTPRQLWYGVATPAKARVTTDDFLQRFIGEFDQPSGIGGNECPFLWGQLRPEICILPGLNDPCVLHPKLLSHSLQASNRQPALVKRAEDSSLRTGADTYGDAHASPGRSASC